METSDNEEAQQCGGGGGGGDKDISEGRSELIEGGDKIQDYSERVDFGVNKETSESVDSSRVTSSSIKDQSEDGRDSNTEFEPLEAHYTDVFDFAGGDEKEEDIYVDNENDKDFVHETYE